jgi:hypothetical protein
MLAHTVVAARTRITHTKDRRLAAIVHLSSWARFYLRRLPQAEELAKEANTDNLVIRKHAVSTGFEEIRPQYTTLQLWLTVEQDCRFSFWMST